MGRILFSLALVMGCGKVNGTPTVDGSIADTRGDSPPGTAGLTVNVVGGGLVVSAPIGLSCTANCTTDFVLGTQVTLTATPAMGGSFLGWSGACSGIGTCVVTVSTTTDVTAMFGCPSGTQTFNFSGAMQTLTRPTCVTHITIDAQGAAGGISAGISVAGQVPGPGGMGGRVQAQLAIVSTDVITVFVGGGGGNATTVPGTAGFNGGGGGACSGVQCGGGGGGASDVRLNGTAVGARVIVAGGGGGGSTACGDGFGGGGGGGLVAADAPTMALCGAPTSNAIGGNQSAGGVGGLYPGYTQGALGTAGVGGGAAASTGGGGAGAGYFGGGGGSWMGGAGGSSFTTATATNVTHTPNVRAGNGTVTITW